MSCKLSSSYSVESEWVILLALLKHVHVSLAHSHIAGVILQTVNEIGVERHAGVLLLLLGELLSWGSLLHLLLLLLGGGLVTWWPWAGTHNASDGLMSNFWTGTEGHTCHESTTESGHHTTTSGGGLLHWCLLLGRSGSHGSLSCWRLVSTETWWSSWWGAASYNTW